ncbi:MAG: 50S ribosomal protein L6 [Deltaproteobacteria bacterium]|nr:50S ribosomal protein L6 [Deltaproteobacteria bacterium]MBW2421520.1 50S ribosomal protein L6 [Deltaproteobacteria bacterium]
MSRIGKLPIPVPDGVTVKLSGGSLSVKGPKGEVSGPVHEGLGVDIDDGEVRVTRPDDSKQSRSLHGLTRALVANMVTGVTTGFNKSLEIQGVGYRGDVKGSKLTLSLGFSHPVVIDVPKGLTVSMEGNTNLKIEGIDKELVGQFAADIRGIRPPEPYKGKGVRYLGERVRRKVGKTGAA